MTQGLAWLCSRLHPENPLNSAFHPLTFTRTGLVIFCLVNRDNTPLFFRVDEFYCFLAGYVLDINGNNIGPGTSGYFLMFRFLWLIS